MSPPAPGDRRGPGPYVALWAAAALGVVLLAVQLDGWAVPDATRLGAMLVVVAVAESVHLQFHWERTRSFFTFTEVGIVGSIVLLPTAPALLVVAAGIAGSQALRRFEPVKIAFNVAQVTVATGAAVGVLALVPAVGPTIAGRPILGVAAGMVAYVALNLLALTGLLWTVAEQRPTEVVRDHGLLSSAAVIGNTALGILLAHVWTTQPSLLPLLAAPLAAMQLSYRGAVRSRALLAQLRTEHDRLDRVVVGTSDGMLLLDVDGTVELWNPALAAMTGIPAADAIGRAISEVLPAERRRGDRPVRGRWLIDEARPGEPSVSEDAVLLRPDGSEVFVHESHTLLFDPRGRCVGDVVVVHDVTRQRELEAMKGDFVARVSHELRTPLTPIRGFAEVLARRADELSPEQRAQAARSIADRAHRMTELVEDLLLAARLDRDRRHTVDPVPTDLAVLVADAVDRFRAEHPGRRLQLFCAPGTGAALADPERTTQILVNVLDNALRYSADDTVVEVGVDQEADDVVVTVTDHGPGIPRDKQDAVFERFHRLEDPLRMRTGGVGLGLFIARSLAEAMHGSLTVRSAVGEGSTFTLRLPTARPRPAEVEYRHADTSLTA